MKLVASDCVASSILYGFLFILTNMVFMPTLSEWSEMFLLYPPLAWLGYLIIAFPAVLVVLSLTYGILGGVLIAKSDKRNNKVDSKTNKSNKIKPSEP